MDEMLERSRRKQNVDFKNFLCRQLAPEGRNRWSALELLKHEFFVPITKQQDIFTTIHSLDSERLRTAVESLTDLNFVNDQGVSLLMHTAKNKNLEAVKILVGSGKADVNFQGKDGLTVLFHAVEAMDVDMVEYLVCEAKADVDVQDEGGDTALFEAVSKRQMEVVRILVEEGRANISHKNEEGKTAIYWAIIRNNVEAAVFLLENCDEDLNVWNGAYEWSYLQTACSNGSLPVVKHLVEKAKVDLKLEDRSKKSVLFWAVESGHEEVVGYLVKNELVDVNKKDKFGETALFKAVQEQRKQRLEIVKCLLGTGKVDISIRRRQDSPIFCHQGG